MFLALLITVGYVFLIWLVFFRFKWIQFSIAWAVVSAFIGLHVLLIFLIGLRFVTPYSTEARVIQHTIRLIPRLPEPTLVTAVLVEPDTPARKGQPLFQFDRRPYEAGDLLPGEPQVRRGRPAGGGGARPLPRLLLSVLQLQQAQLASQSQLIKLHNAKLANRVQLHLALGGSFDAQPAVQTTAMLLNH